MAIILPKENKNAINVFALSCIITIIISVIVLFPVLIFSEEIGALLDNGFKTAWLYFIPVSILATGLSQALINWLNRRERYTEISLSRVSRSSVTGGTSIFFGFLPFKEIGLVIGDVIGQIVGLFYLIYKFFRQDGDLVKVIDRNNIIDQGKRYSQFPKFNVASGLFEKVAGHLPVFFLTSFFGPAITGYFSLSQRVISAPSAIVARAIGDVFRVEANNEFLETGSAKKIFRKTFIKLLAISVVPFVILFFFAADFFVIIFGSDWLVAGQYAQTMTVMFFLQFVVSPLSNMFLVAEKQKIDLYVQVFLVAAVAAVMVLGEKISGTPGVVIFLFTIVYSCKYLIELILSYRFSRGHSLITGN